VAGRLPLGGRERRAVVLLVEQCLQPGLRARGPLEAGQLSGNLDRLRHDARLGGLASPDYSPAKWIGGEVSPEEFAGVAGGEVETDAIGQFADPAGDLEQVQP
jgi:hypothetical protein